MPLRLTRRKRDEIDALNQAIEALMAKTPESIWTGELRELKVAIADYRTRLAARYSTEAPPAHDAGAKLERRRGQGRSQMGEGLSMLGLDEPGLAPPRPPRSPTGAPPLGGRLPQ